MLDPRWDDASALRPVLPFYSLDEGIQHLSEYLEAIVNASVELFIFQRSRFIESLKVVDRFVARSLGECQVTDILLLVSSASVAFNDGRFH